MKQFGCSGMLSGSTVCLVLVSEFWWDWVGIICLIFAYVQVHL